MGGDGRVCQGYQGVGFDYKCEHCTSNYCSSDHCSSDDCSSNHCDNQKEESEKCEQNEQSEYNEQSEHNKAKPQGPLGLRKFGGRFRQQKEQQSGAKKQKERERERSLPINGYTPQQIKQVYGIGEKTCGTGRDQIIAIINAYGYPTLINDLNVFSQQFNLPMPRVIGSLDTMPPYSMDRFNIMIHSMASSIHIDNNWALEQSLDIQWAHAMAPHATLLVVQAVSSGYTDLFSAMNYAISMRATVISLSWGGAESLHQLNFDKYFNLDKNVVFIASSGDTPGVMYPSASPHVLSVGGTTLRIGSKDNEYVRISEKVWYTNNTSSTGGGVSMYEKKVHQHNITYTNRVTPDVSFNADPMTGVAIYNSMFSGWLKIGGTSFSAPAWAGIIAMGNQKRNMINKPHLSNKILSQGIYGLLDTNNKAQYTKYFYDIKNGQIGDTVASPGYDPLSGMGVPHVDKLLDYLCTL
jgi:subtilase family serine protease